MAKRVQPSPNQKRRLYQANAYRCCVCKRRGIGMDLHHIDGDPSNTVDANLAVLCVEEHDRHHRPSAYHVQHLELTPARIRKCKSSWETFVAEARKKQPRVVAALTCYGTFDLVHSAELVFQWPDERIEGVVPFHLLEGNFESWADEICKEVSSLGPNLKLMLVNQPQPVEHCPCCGRGLSHTVKSAIVVRETDARWSSKSICSIYVNPDRPSLAILMSLGEQQELLRGSLHLCQGRFLHYHCDWYDERLPLRKWPSIRAQASGIVRRILDDWKPARIFIGTGNPDVPTLTEKLRLPACWEGKGASAPRREPTRLRGRSGKRKRSSRRS
jgi:hypothetical protein